MTSAFRLSIIAVATLGCFFSGCNSHASFEDNNANNSNNTNNGNCGNQEFDTGEDCDFTTDMIPIFPDPEDSCQTRGFAYGDLGCTDGCKIDISECHNEESCDPIFDSPCGASTNCYFSSSGGYPETACNEPGTTLEGQPCDASFDCVPRMTCYDNGDGNGSLCRRVCEPGATCPNEGICQGMADWLDGNLGVCPLQTGECDPVSGGGCAGGDGCYINSGMGGGHCAPAGDGQTGDPCGPDTECTPGHVCSDVQNSQESVCTRLCNFDYPCASGICGYFPGVQAGICLDSYDCAGLLDGGGCPDGNTYCSIVNPYGDTACVTTNSIGEGGPCDMFTRCAPGFYCNSDDDHKCHQLCLDSTQCTYPASCTGPWAFQDVHGFCI